MFGARIFAELASRISYTALNARMALIGEMATFSDALYNRTAQRQIHQSHEL